MVPIKRYNQETKEDETIYRYVWHPTKLGRKNAVLTVAKRYAKTYGMRPSELVKEVSKIAEDEGKPVLQCLNFEFLDHYFFRAPVRKKQRTDTSGEPSNEPSKKLNREVYEKFLAMAACEEIISDIIDSVIKITKV